MLLPRPAPGASPHLALSGTGSSVGAQWKGGKQIESISGAKAQALQDAIEGGEVGMMELIRLLECYGDHINAQDHDGTTALHSAALAGSGRIVALLLSYNADVHVVSTLGETALHFAAREGHFEAAMLLSQSGGSDGKSDGGAQVA